MSRLPPRAQPRSSSKTSTCGRAKLPVLHGLTSPCRRGASSDSSARAAAARRRSCARSSACRCVQSGTHRRCSACRRAARQLRTPRRLRHPAGQRLRRPHGARRTSATSARVLGAPASDVDRVIERTDLGSVAEPARRLAVGRPARPRLARRGPARQRPSCSCSTSRPSASTRCCASNCGRCSAASPRRAVTLLVSSHVMDEAKRCDRLLLMRDGELLADDTRARPARGHRHRRRRERVPAAHRRGTPDPRDGSSRGGAAMNPGRTFATAGRVLDPDPPRPAHDRACCCVVPSLLIGLVAWIFTDTDGVRPRSVPR